MFKEISRTDAMESMDQNLRNNQINKAKNADYIYVLKGTSSYVLSESLKIIKGTGYK